jgi:hypothetical protein
MASVCGSIISTVVVEWAGTGSFRDVIVTPAVTAREITGNANDRIAIATEVFPRLEKMSLLVQSSRPAVLTRAQAAEVAALLLADIAADIGLDPARLGNGDLTPQLGDSTDYLLQFLVTMETGADQQAFPALSISIRNLEALGGVSADYQNADLGEISFQSAAGSSTTTAVATNTGAGTAAGDGGISDSTLYILIIVVIIAVCAGLVLLFFWRRRSQEHQKLLFNVISGAGAGAGFSEQQFVSADGDLDLERWWSMTDDKGSAAPPVSGASAAGTAAGRAHFYPGAGAGADARSTGSSPEDHGGYFQSHKLGLSEFDDRGMSTGHYYPENSANLDAWVSGGGGTQPPPPPPASKAAAGSFITMPRSPFPVGAAGAKWKLWSPMGSAKTEPSPTKANPAPALDGQALQDFQATNTMTVDAELNQRNSHASHRSRPALDESVATEYAAANGIEAAEITKNRMFLHRSSQFEEEPVRPNELKDNRIFRGRARQDNGDPQTHDWAGNPLPADLLDPLRRRRASRRLAQGEEARRTCGSRR